IALGLFLVGFRQDLTTGLRVGVFATALTIVGVAVLLAPWLARAAQQVAEERRQRIRSEERERMAAHLHDSVLQTLALIQRHAQEPRRVASLARRQERELRGWLYGDRPLGDQSSLVAALSAVAADIEELHGVRVELASAGDATAEEPLVLAAREAMTNAAKFAGVEEIDVYVDVEDDVVSVFVRDRGTGFDRAAVPDDRRGIVESIEGRLARAGGSAVISAAPGGGTEVELRLPRVAP
ncbi:MAG: sensor histidine kinase, partial [Gaiellaceae bacterium]